MSKKWVCDVCRKPANRMASKEGKTYFRHEKCENTAAPLRGPKFQLLGGGWADQGYSKDKPKP
jgi:hypothetical protein